MKYHSEYSSRGLRLRQRANILIAAFVDAALVVDCQQAVSVPSVRLTPSGVLAIRSSENSDLRSRLLKT